MESTSVISRKERMERKDLHVEEGDFVNNPYMNTVIHIREEISSLVFYNLNNHILYYINHSYVKLAKHKINAQQHNR